VAKTDQQTGEVVDFPVPQEPSFRAGEILKRLHLVAAELGPIGKEERAPANMGGYAYRGIDTIVIGLAPLLHKHGVTIIPRVLEWSREQYANAAGKPMVNMTARVAYRFFAEDGSFLEAVVLGEASDSGDKSSPKAMTAAFKQALLQALTIPTGGDDTEAHGEEVTRGSPASRERPAPTPQEQKVMKNGKPWPKWWRVGDKMLDRSGEPVYGVLVDKDGKPVDAEGILHWPPDEPMMSGGKGKQWPTLEGSPFGPLSCYQMLETAIRARKAGKLTPADDPIAWVMATAGKGAYGGRPSWPGQTAVALDVAADNFLEAMAGKEEPAAAPEPAPGAQAPAPAAAPTDRGTWKEGDPVPADHDPDDETCLCLMCVPF
jgi:hypothetical protein